MLSPSQRFQVLDPVIKRVPVPVVNDVPARDRAMRHLPNHHRPRPPHVRLRHLDPSARFAPARPDGYRAERSPVRRIAPSLELRRRRSVLTFSRRLEVPCPLRCTGVGAEVHGAPLGRLAVEGRPAHGARKRGHRWSRPSKCAPVGLATPRRAEDQPRRISCEPVRLHVERPTATATRRFHCNSVAAGSGATLAVATGHSRDAIGIDLDARNVDLAMERVGPMFFTDLTLDQYAARQAVPA